MEHQQSFWKCPQFIAACRQMGIIDMEKLAKKILNSEAYSKRNISDPLSWESLIEVAFFCHYQDFSENTPPLLKIGKYGFRLAYSRLAQAHTIALQDVLQKKIESD